MKIAVVTPVLVPGDAVSNDVLGMASVLKKAGHDAQIFAAQNLVPDTQVGSIENLENFLDQRKDIFLYHFSIGWDHGLHLLRTLQCRKVVKYHNVTPPEFFEGINGDYAHVCKAGRAMLRDIGGIPADVFLSDSAYNMEELISAGAARERSLVVPPFHHIDRLLEGDADLETLDKMRDGLTNILMVGRLAPNKGHIDLVKAFALYHRQYNPLSRLLIVGKHDPRLSRYIDAVREEIGKGDLNGHVHFTEEVSEHQLRAYFLATHVFAITSEHEGFCVPMVEAMAYHVPVTAYASTAITETLGPAGLLWPERDPRLMAASINEVVTNPEVADGLGQLGWERYRTRFRNDLIAKAFLEAMEPMLTTKAQA
jgi:glycosyltransferase involved in cell wall biosynthesis